MIFWALIKILSGIMQGLMAFEVVSFSKMKWLLHQKVYSELFSSVSVGQVSVLKYYPLFLLISLSNLIGLWARSQHLIISSFSLVILFSVIYLWGMRYSPFYARKKSKSQPKLTRLLIVNINIPSLSILLSLIEIITHLFRPITLFARIWVNLWVGHLLLGVCRYLFLLATKGPLLRSITLSVLIIAYSLLLIILQYEVLVSLLQPLVLVYLSVLYLKDNIST